MGREADMLRREADELLTNTEVSVRQRSSEAISRAQKRRAWWRT